MCAAVQFSKYFHQVIIRCKPPSLHSFEAIFIPAAAVQVQVKRRGDDQKFIAEVLAIGSECDVALLTVKDEAFWEGANPLELGSLPRLQVS